MARPHCWAPFEPFFHCTNEPCISELFLVRAVAALTEIANRRGGLRNMFFFRSHVGILDMRKAVLQIIVHMMELCNSDVRNRRVRGDGLERRAGDHLHELLASTVQGLVNQVGNLDESVAALHRYIVNHPFSLIDHSVEHLFFETAKHVVHFGHFIEELRVKKLPLLSSDVRREVNRAWIFGWF